MSFLKMQPALTDRYLCIVDRHAFVLAAVISSYLFEMESYLPLFMFLYVLCDLCPRRDYVRIEFPKNGTYRGLSKGSAKGVDGRFVPSTVRNENARHAWIPLSMPYRLSVFV